MMWKCQRETKWNKWTYMLSEGRLLCPTLRLPRHWSPARGQTRSLLHFILWHAAPPDSQFPAASRFISCRATLPASHMRWKLRDVIPEVTPTERHLAVVSGPTEWTTSSIIPQIYEHYGVYINKYIGWCVNKANPYSYITLKALNLIQSQKLSRV